jgi:hypothetical protein
MSPSSGGPPKGRQSTDGVADEIRRAGGASCDQKPFCVFCFGRTALKVYRFDYFLQYSQQIWRGLD